MTTRQAREVLAQLEVAAHALYRARDVIDFADILADSKAERLEHEVGRAVLAVEEATQTCRVVLRMEERYAVRQTERVT